MFNSPEISELIQMIAAELAVDQCFIEKDLYAMQVIGVLSTIQDPDLQLIFSGGTSLSKGFGLIQRFSEDLDFKVQVTGNYPSKDQRKTFREKVLDVLEKNQIDWQLDQDKLEKGNQSKFFKVPIRYQPQFEVSQSLRPYVQLEVTFEPPVLDPITKSLQSFVSQALNQEPEAIAFPCIDPVETAADKLSALVWRIPARNRHSETDDATLVRHLHDLAALSSLIQESKDFPQLFVNCLNNDQHRGNKKAAITVPLKAINFLVETFKTDTLYQEEYEKFVDGMSYADDSQRLSFSDALQSLVNLAGLF